MNEIIETEEKIIEPKEGDGINYKQQLDNIKAVLQQMPQHHRHTLYLWLSLEFGKYK